MRDFFHSHWKAVVALILLILVAVLTFRPDNAEAAPDLAERMRQHVRAVAFNERNTGTPAQLERAAVYIETALARAGYTPVRQEYTAGGQRVRNIEAALGNVLAGKRPERIFIVGANDNGSGTAAVLELARLLNTMQPRAGTEVRFVFFVHEEPPWLIGVDLGAAPGSMRHAAALKRPSTGNFLAFAGTLESSKLVRDALAAFRAGSDFPAHGLAAPAHTTGVTLSDHASYNRHGYPALMIADTAFMRYPYYHTAQDTPDQPDYESMARVVTGLSKTIVKLAGAAEG